MQVNSSNIQPHYTINETNSEYPAAQCQLHLLIAPTSISIAIYHVEKNLFCSLKKYLVDAASIVDSLDKLFLQEALLQFHYQSYHIHLFAVETILIPYEANENIITDMLFEDIAALEATMYYKCPKELLNYFNKKSYFNIHSSSAQLLQNLIKKQALLKTPVVYAHCFDTHLEVIAFDDKQLVLHTIFPIEQPEDFTYLILSVYESLQFSTAKVRTVLIGTISKPSRIYDLLYTYIHDVEFINILSSINYHNAFNDIEDHIIYPLASLFKP
ncbi:MAG: DUF3822 family protein [Bacteroidota bacterium]